MTNDELIAAARARLAEHGANSAVMKELAAVLAAYDEKRLRDLNPRPLPGAERRQAIQDVSRHLAGMVRARAQEWRMRPFVILAPGQVEHELKMIAAKIDAMRW